jgi:CRP/FNR family transcriptional regulator, cyclic AMP receptor protein
VGPQVAHLVSGHDMIGGSAEDRQPVMRNARLQVQRRNDRQQFQRRAREFFFRENDQATSMFVLESGKAVVLKGWRGHDIELHRLRAGDCFGDMALMDLFPRSASVCATEVCRAIELSAADLLRLFERDAEQFALIQMNIDREVCRRLRATDERLFKATTGEQQSGLETLFLDA